MIQEHSIDTLTKILLALHEQRFEDVRALVSESEIEELADYLAEYVQGTLALNGFESIDVYGAPCSFSPSYEYSQLEFDQSEDGSGASIEYAMTSGSELVDMVLRLDFSIGDDGEVRSTFVSVDPS